MNFRQVAGEEFELDVNNNREIRGTIDVRMNNNIVHRNVSTNTTNDRGVIISFTPFFIRGPLRRYFIILKSVEVNLTALVSNSPANMLHSVTGLMADDNSDSRSSVHSLKTIPNTEVPPKQSTCKYTLPKALNFSMRLYGLIISRTMTRQFILYPRIA